MKLPFYFKTCGKSSCPPDGKSKPSSLTGEKKTICGVESSIEIQFQDNYKPVYLVLQFFLTWLPILLILCISHYIAHLHLESQRLEVAHLRTEINSLNAEVNFLRKEIKLLKVPRIDENHQITTKEGEKEANPITDQNLDLLFPRQKRGASEELKNDVKKSSPSPRELPTINSARRGTLAIHLKGAHPETVVDAGHVGPWFIDHKAVQDRKVSSSFQLREDGESVEVESSGMYFIYAQIYYLTTHVFNSFTIMLAPKDLAHPVALAYCSSNAVSASSTSEVSCFTAALHTLQSGDRIYIQQREKHRRLIMRPGHSFLGLIKFGAN